MRVGDQVEAWVLAKGFKQVWVPAKVTRVGLVMNRVEVNLDHPLFGPDTHIVRARNLVRPI